MSSTAGLDRLIGQLDGEYLANFCSILAVTISDLDVYENKTLCKYLRSMKARLCVCIYSVAFVYSSLINMRVVVIVNDTLSQLHGLLASTAQTK